MWRPARLSAPGQQRGGLLVALLGQRLAALLARRGPRRAALPLTRVRLLYLDIDEGPEDGALMSARTRRHHQEDVSWGDTAHTCNLHTPKGKVFKNTGSAGHGMMRYQAENYLRRLAAKLCTAHRSRGVSSAAWHRRCSARSRASGGSAQ